MIERIKDDFVKSYRLQQSLEALEQVKGDISKEAYKRLRALLRYRLYGEEFERSKIDEKIALAFSMGSDSTASLLILKWAGFDVVPLMVKLPQMRDVVLFRAQSYGAVFVEIPNYIEVISDQIQKRAPICGKCHSMIMDAVKNYARENGIKIVASGDLLSFGSISIYKDGDLIRLNLPAFLAIDKREAIKILGRKYAVGFGCSLWKGAIKNAPILKRFGIQRVLRELRAGAIDKEIAKTLIRDILKN
ncbi:ATPase [Thermococcus sp. MV5]|uniref:ATPase n=1 Tax=Thermococcus sp. MV5 TaxID=1638272 RepID=UPI00143C8BCB|nr:ATPase [Thermococcus sp. MV5]NJE25315.1 ATPase [Thermococcus sp. MV5]